MFVVEMKLPAPEIELSFSDDEAGIDIVSYY